MITTILYHLAVSLGLPGFLVCAVHRTVTRLRVVLPQCSHAFAPVVPWGYDPRASRANPAILFSFPFFLQRVQGTKYIASVQAPASLNIAPPTLYWLYVLDNGVPNVEAAAVNFTRRGV